MSYSLEIEGLVRHKQRLEAENRRLRKRLMDLPAITDADRLAAADAIVSGWNKCKGRELGPGTCKCDLGRIDGCVTRVEAIAQAIALARNE